MDKCQDDGAGVEEQMVLQAGTRVLVRQQLCGHLYMPTARSS